MFLLNFIEKFQKHPTVKFFAGSLFMPTLTTTITVPVALTTVSSLGLLALGASKENITDIAKGVFFPSLVSIGFYSYISRVCCHLYSFKRYGRGYPIITHRDFNKYWRFESKSLLFVGKAPFNLNEFFKAKNFASICALYMAIGTIGLLNLNDNELRYALSNPFAIQISDVHRLLDKVGIITGLATVGILHAAGNFRAAAGRSLLVDYALFTNNTERFNDIFSYSLVKVLKHIRRYPEQKLLILNHIVKTPSRRFYIKNSSDIDSIAAVLDESESGRKFAKKNLAHLKFNEMPGFIESITQKKHFTEALVDASEIRKNARVLGQYFAQPAVNAPEPNQPPQLPAEIVIRIASLTGRHGALTEQQANKVATTYALAYKPATN